MTTIYLIRHAEAEGNVFRRLHGQYDSNVTPNGLKQIAALAKRFESIPIDAVYASDLTRTCTTAGAVYKPKNLPLHKEPRFRELNCGVWEDLPFGWLDHTDPERNRAFSHDPQNWSVEGSEGFATYTGRFLEALEEVARRHEGQTVAIFSHGMVLRGVQQRLFFPEKRDLPHSENTAVTKLLWDGAGYRLEYLNDASHLPLEISTLGRQQWWRGGEHKDHNMWYHDPETTDAPLLAALDIPAGEVTRISMLVDTPTGALTLRSLDAETDEIVYLAVLPEYRGKGFSAQLLGEAVSLARKRGKRFLQLGAPAEHPAAKRLFATYGFAEDTLSLQPVIR